MERYDALLFALADDEEHVGGAGAAERRHGVDHALGDLVAAADGGEEGGDGVGVLGRGSRPQREHARALAHHARSVRHQADNLKGNRKYE